MSDFVANLLSRLLADRATLLVGVASVTVYPGGVGLFATAIGAVNARALNLITDRCLVAKVDGIWVAIGDDRSTEIVTTVHRSLRSSVRTPPSIEPRFISVNGVVVNGRNKLLLVHIDEPELVMPSDSTDLEFEGIRLFIYRPGDDIEDLSAVERQWTIFLINLARTKVYRIDKPNIITSFNLPANEFVYFLGEICAGSVADNLSPPSLLPQLPYIRYNPQTPPLIARSPEFWEWCEGNASNANIKSQLFNLSLWGFGLNMGQVNRPVFRDLSNGNRPLFEAELIINNPGVYQSKTTVKLGTQTFNITTSESSQVTAPLEYYDSFATSPSLSLPTGSVHEGWIDISFREIEEVEYYERETLHSDNGVLLEIERQVEKGLVFEWVGQLTEYYKYFFTNFYQVTRNERIEIDNNGNPYTFYFHTSVALGSSYQFSGSSQAAEPGDTVDLGYATVLIKSAPIATVPTVWTRKLSVLPLIIKYYLGGVEVDFNTGALANCQVNTIDGGQATIAPIDLEALVLRSHVETYDSSVYRTKPEYTGTPYDYYGQGYWPIAVRNLEENPQLQGLKYGALVRSGIIYNFVVNDLVFTTFRKTDYRAEYQASILIKKYEVALKFDGVSSPAQGRYPNGIFDVGKYVFNGYRTFAGYARDSDFYNGGFNPDYWEDNDYYPFYNRDRDWLNRDRRFSFSMSVAGGALELKAHHPLLQRGYAIQSETADPDFDVVLQPGYSVFTTQVPVMQQINSPFTDAPNLDYFRRVIGFNYTVTSSHPISSLIDVGERVILPTANNFAGSRVLMSGNNIYISSSISPGSEESTVEVWRRIGRRLELIDIRSGDVAEYENSAYSTQYYPAP